MVIPCFNAAPTLPMQLEELFTQEDAPSFEIIVADNRSTDDLDAVIAVAVPPPGVQVRFVRADAIAGAGYARNVAMAAARADRLMFCDADDVVSRWWVAHGIQAFRDAEVWSGSCHPAPDAAFDGGVDAVRALIDDSPDWLPSVREQEGTAFPILMGGDFGATAEALRRIGGFDVTIPAGGEDNDFAVRAVRAGYPAVSCKVARIAYRQRREPRARAREAVRAARTHALLANRFGLWDRSHFRNWPSALARTGAAAGRMALRPRAEQDWWAVGTRAAVAAAVGFDPRSARFIRAQYVSLAHALGRDRDLDARVLPVLWELAIRARATGVPWWETVRMTWRARRGAPTMKAWGYRTALALIPRR
ncbi:glycosyltransferase family 2 protein [Helcobacillus massiliensis]|uniref:glycosyltransferase family A protein n=1 Tax=Helcobacillus massiliensis TaxID=521392 RepID=UPI0021A5DEAF|nr:glycosyltransferase family A protein [Helcobacillus massiliensis]MCT1556759.1 glycosyltransferase family 2 protein [Helcobacillus massiliensis]MCT2035583.1 glycosyltransferase family 2 protein [Helcobacillus massiliensis]MCT2330965.1 glycosyltransferase family 2 protein [Helcobacillus massiliensis]